MKIYKFILYNRNKILNSISDINKKTTGIYFADNTCFNDDYIYFHNACRSNFVHRRENFFETKQ